MFRCDKRRDTCSSRSSGFRVEAGVPEAAAAVAAVWTGPTQSSSNNNNNNSNFAVAALGRISKSRVAAAVEVAAAPREATLLLPGRARPAERRLMRSSAARFSRGTASLRRPLSQRRMPPGDDDDKRRDLPPLGVTTPATPGTAPLLLLLLLLLLVLMQVLVPPLELQAPCLRLCKCVRGLLGPLRRFPLRRWS